MYSVFYEVHAEMLKGGQLEKVSPESETVKYGLSPTGRGPENDCTGKGQQQL
jgi:hypothetical protein